ncbi:AI-2E family transporter [Paenibacillaceae bacterium]|nr:AI-2E family transporter [Paenibacillaceae bacterium]
MQGSSSQPSSIKVLFTNRKFVVFLGILLLIGVNILVYSRVSFIFVPLQALVKTVMLPLILAGVVFYLLNPLVDMMERRKIRRVYSIVVLYLLMIGLVTLIIVTVVPFVSGQVVSLVNNVPDYAQKLQIQFNELLGYGFIADLQNTVQFDPADFTQKVTEWASSIIQNTWASIGSLVGAIKEVVLAIITLPFILFYLLKDGKKLPIFISRFFPNAVQTKSLTLMSEMNHQISSYIRGQIIISFCIGFLLYIGYLIIGLDYSLALAAIAACTSIVPYLGPAIAITPALIVSAVTSPIMLVKMIIVWTVVQLVEGKFISPQIMGKNMHIHPITIIFVILTAGNLFGILGIVLAIPGYAILKVVFTNLFQWFKQRSPLYNTK